VAASVPQLLKIVTLTLGATSFKEDAISCQVVNEAGDVQSVLTLDGIRHQDAAASSWFLEIEAVIDWDTTRPGLAYYLFNNEGDTVAFVFNAHDAAISTSKPAITGSCVLVPLPYGGTGNEYATATVRLPITGALTVDTTP
jgi:hypothetical protein